MHETHINSPNNRNLVTLSKNHTITSLADSNINQKKFIQKQKKLEKTAPWQNELAYGKFLYTNFYLPKTAVWTKNSFRSSLQICSIFKPLQIF